MRPLPLVSCSRGGLRLGGSPSGSLAISAAVLGRALLIGGFTVGSLGFSANHPATPPLSDGPLVELGTILPLVLV